MPGDWQEINAECHSCHSWQECERRMIGAMTTALLIGLVVVALVAYLAYLGRLIAGDGYGHRSPSGLPRSHRPDTFEPRPLA